MLLALLLAAAQPGPAQPAAAQPAPSRPAPYRPADDGRPSIEVTETVLAYRDWRICLDAAAARIAPGGSARPRQLDRMFEACRRGQRRAEASVIAAFGPAAGAQMANDFRGRARAELAARNVPFPDPIPQANVAWSLCIGAGLVRGRDERRGRSDAVLVDAAFAGCAREERIYRAALAGAERPSQAEAAIAAVRARVHAEAATLLAPR